MAFDLHIGIDYSGAKTPASRLAGLRVYAVSGEGGPVQVSTPAAPQGKRWNWTRREIAEWLIRRVQAGQRLIAGIDHGFGFPEAYLDRYSLSDWDGFLADFCRHWPTDGDHTYVDFIRDEGPGRTGSSDELRLTERWTSSAKSVFRFDVQGQVAKSTHAGIPWLARIRCEVSDRVHFWPFDGWDVPKDRSVLAEVYPSIFRNRYAREGRTADEQDAYSIAHWLAESDRRGILDHYLHPPLTDAERRTAEREGWILGIA